MTAMIAIHLRAIAADAHRLEVAEVVGSATGHRDAVVNLPRTAGAEPTMIAEGEVDLASRNRRIRPRRSRRSPEGGRQSTATRPMLPARRAVLRAF